MPTKRGSGSGNNEVLLLLGQIDGKLDGLAGTIERHLADDSAAFASIDKRLRAVEVAAPSQEKQDAQDKRITALERFRWQIAGMATLGGFLAGIAAKAIL